MKTIAISVKDLCFSYPPQTEDGEEIQVFDHLDLDIEQGAFVAVLGHNGCGKSTLAKHFNAINLPCGGKVSVYGMDTADESLLLPIRRCIGMVFQNPDNQIVSNVVEEDVAFAPENLGVEPEEIRRRVDEALELVGMKEFCRYAPHLLSGGQKQRIAIAGVIAMRPKCIVLDEPTAMLDPLGRKEVMDTIEKLKRESGITTVLITHHMPEAALADRVVVLNKGTVLTDGSPSEVFSKVELLRSVGLDAPDTTRLLFALNQNGCDFPLDVFTEDDCVRVLADYLRDCVPDLEEKPIGSDH